MLAMLPGWAKRFLRQICVEEGVPGKGVLLQFANAQSPLGISTTPVRTPTLFSCAMEISFDFVVSRLAGVRPRPGSDCVLTLPATVTKRAKVGPVTPWTTGTSIVSAGSAGLNTRSPCQPLHK